MNDGEDVVGVAAVLLPVISKTKRDHVELAFGDRVIPGWVEAAKVDPLGICGLLPKRTPRGPREVVHVALVVAKDVPPLVGRGGNARTRGADDESRGNIDRHVVRAEVRVKLGQMVERKVAPFTGGLEAGELRKPLRHHVEVVPVSGAFDDARHLGVP